jgi:hypothetical protein
MQGDPRLVALRSSVDRADGNTDGSAFSGRDLKPRQRRADGTPDDLFDDDGTLLLAAEDFMSPDEARRSEERRQRQADEFWAEHPREHTARWLKLEVLPTVVGSALTIAFVVWLALAFWPLAVLGLPAAMFIRAMWRSLLDVAP